MIKIVKGNLLRLSMPLQLRSVVDGEESIRDFVPTGPVYVLVSDGAPRHRYVAVMDGNKAVVEDNGTLELGAYNVEVYCQDEAGHNYRHKIRNAFQVVDTACEACMEAGVEFSVESHTLEGAVFASYGITEETDPTVPDWVKDITEEDIERWDAGTDQVQADWEETDTTNPAYIRNKPTIPDVPTNVSAFVNDAHYLTEHQDISGKVDKETGKGLSTNDYTTAEKTKLAGLENYDDTALAGRVSTLERKEFVETDPTVPQWAKQPNKPSYTAREVGALPDTTEIPSKTSDLENDSGYLTQHQDVSGKADKSDTYTKAQVDTLVADAGKVKTVSVNGTTYQPDTQGDVDLGTIQGGVGASGFTVSETATSLVLTVWDGATVNESATAITIQQS